MTARQQRWVTHDNNHDSDYNKDYDDINDSHDSDDDKLIEIF